VGVQLESGETVPCDVVVSNADPSFVYERMIDPAHMSAARSGGRAG
jgi:hypothetical protein